MYGLMIPSSALSETSAPGTVRSVGCKRGGEARVYDGQHLPAPAVPEPICPPPAATKSRHLIRSPTEEDQPTGTARPHPKGVTLIEMLMAMVIIAVLMTIALPMIQDVLDRARVARAIGDVRAVQTDLQTYETDGKGLPASLSAIGRGDMVDPWGYAYRYLRFPDDGSKPKGARKDRFLVPVNSTFDLYSVGKDGGTSAAMTANASQDDIVRANDGGFIGLASKF